MSILVHHNTQGFNYTTKICDHQGQFLSFAIILEIIIILYAEHMRVLSWPQFQMQLIITMDAKENKPRILSKLDVQ